jgi:sulfur-oxidizing protein SoxY
MNRRKFLGLSTVVAAAALVPSSLSAVNFRETKPKAFTATKLDEALKALFGTSKTTEGKVKLKAPDIAENGAVIPVTVSSKLAGKTVAVFQEANPEVTCAVYTVPANGIIDYSLRIKMQKTANVIAVVNVDGKLYSAKKTVKVTIGGCGG